MKPNFSVVTPCLNAGEFLDNAIQSVYRQQGVTVEHIVTDGGSTDNTLELLQAHSHLKWTSQKDGGQSDAINRGFLQASGELLGWLNADDYYLPGGLAAIDRAARQHPEADVFYGDCVFVNQGGSIVRSKVEHDFDYKILLHFGCYMPSTATFFRRRLIEGGNLLDIDYGVCMDFEYFTRLAWAGYKFFYVPQFIAAFRWHENNVSLQNTARRRKERLQVQHRFGKRWQSAGVLDLLSYAYRGKRAFWKVLTGNIAREWSLRQMIGRDTLWIERTEALETCANLASL
jgi:glycosyltransferase involved in cell wall biosynthesis